MGRLRTALACIFLLASAPFAASAASKPLSQRWMEAIWNHAELFVGICLEESFTDVCGIDAGEKTLLRAIFTSLPEERAKGGLRFASGKERPDLFVLPGEESPRTGVTGSKVGTPIFFNLDRLNLPAPLTPFSAIALLVHELGHHHGISEHHRLEVLGAKAQKGLEAQGQLLTFEDHHQPQVAVFSVDPVPSLRIRFPFAALFVTDGIELRDLAELLSQSLVCGQRTGRARSLELNTLFAERDWDWNPWAKYSVIPIHSHARVGCVGPGEKIEFREQYLRLSVGLESRPPGKRDWYETKPGHLIPELLMIGSVTNSESERSPQSRVKILRASPEVVSDGGKWEIEALAEVDGDEPLLGCRGQLLGEKSYHDEFTGIIAPSMDSCRVTPDGPHRYRLHLTHAFLPSTFPRTYFFVAVTLSFRGVKLPSVVLPAQSTTVLVESSHPEPRIRVSDARIGDFRPVRADREAFYYRVPEKTPFWLGVTVESESPPVSGVLVYDFWTNDNRRGSLALEYFAVRDTGPFASGTRVTKVGKGKWLLEMRIQFPQKGLVMTRVSLNEAVVVTRAYRDGLLLFDGTKRIYVGNAHD